jgi:hypothetical protein
MLLRHPSKTFDHLISVVVQVHHCKWLFLVEGEVVPVSPSWDLAQETLKGGASDGRG